MRTRYRSIGNHSLPTAWTSLPAGHSSWEGTEAATLQGSASLPGTGPKSGRKGRQTLRERVTFASGAVWPSFGDTFPLKLMFLLTSSDGPVLVSSLAHANSPAGCCAAPTVRRTLGAALRASGNRVLSVRCLQFPFDFTCPPAPRTIIRQEKHKLKPLTFQEEAGRPRPSIW